MSQALLDCAHVHLDRFSKRMSEMTGERGGFSGKETARKLLGQSLTSE